LYYAYSANNILIRAVPGSFLSLGGQLLVSRVCVQGA